MLPASVTIEAGSVQTQVRFLPRPLNKLNMKLERYKQNLRVIGSNVYSYDTLVAEIVGTELHKVPWRVNGMTSSPTTSKHVNYVARELNLKLI